MNSKNPFLCRGIKRTKLKYKIMILTKEQQKEFEEKARPLMEWMGENFDPHVKAIIDYSDAEILQSSMTFRTEDYVGD
jgi:hypothetical protein